MQVDIAQGEKDAEDALEADHKLRTVTVVNLRKRHLCKRIQCWYKKVKEAKVAAEKAKKKAAAKAAKKK